MSNLLKGAALFVGGALVGAAAALLLTPKPGEEVRKDLADLAEACAGLLRASKERIGGSRSSFRGCRGRDQGAQGR